MSEDRTSDLWDRFRSDIDRLCTVFERTVQVHRYATSRTSLLKCPSCARYYHRVHYDDRGEHAMDPASDEVELLRYDAYTAREFLLELARDPGAVGPPPSAELRLAFFEDRTARAGEALPGPSCERESAEAEARYPALMAELSEALERGALVWPVREFIVVSVCNQRLVEGDLARLEREVFRNPDVAVRVEGLMHVVGIGMRDAPSVHQLHARPEMRTAARGLVGDPERLETVLDCLVECAEAEPAQVYRRESCVGFQPLSTRERALYGLRVCAKHGGDLAPRIERIVGLLARDCQLAAGITGVLRNYVEHGGEQGALLSAILGLPQESRDLLTAEAYLRGLLGGPA